MSTSHLQFTARIQGSPETVFDLLADLPNYGRWLPGSNAFGATTQVVPYPVRLGTTYLDAGPAGEPLEGATNVVRTVDLRIDVPGVLKIAEPIVVSAFRKENRRILAELKRYVEGKS